jgi:hypothetical protein
VPRADVHKRYEGYIAAGEGVRGHGNDEAVAQAGDG